MLKAAQSGRKAECSFWDQSLDSGFGAWSTEGCTLISEDREAATCHCDHLTNFALITVSPLNVLSAAVMSVHAHFRTLLLRKRRTWTMVLALLSILGAYSASSCLW